MQKTKITKLFSFYRKQKDWLARALLTDGAVIALEPGLGKTLFGLAWAWLKGSRRCIIVAPGDLHLQWIKEARDKFGIEIKRVRTLAEAHALGLTTPLSQLPNVARPGIEGLPPMPEFYITSYTALGMNGGDEWPGNTRVQRTDEEGQQYWLTTGKEQIVNKREKTMAATYGRALTPIEFQAASNGIGQAMDPEQHKLVTSNPFDPAHIACVWRPTLATAIGHSFDCILCDEAVRLKNRDSLQARGIFRIHARYRLGLTGTPIKNRLPDIAMLNWYCTGGDHTGNNPRWPYSPDHKDIAAFEQEYLVLEENISAAIRTARETGERRVIKKRTAQICNVHRLWKSLGPCVLRGRKGDIADELPKKTLHPVLCEMGTAQAEIYAYHLKNPPEIAKSTGKPLSPLAQIGAQLQALRQAAVDPSSPNLDPHSPYDISFKMQALFDLTSEIVGEGEQFVIMAPFTAFAQALEARLREAGIKCARLDGGVSPTARGQHVARFKAGHLSVLVCCQSSMSEGHSLECASKLALVSLDHALDKNLQAIDRVHRMTSPRDVDIYIFLTRGTIDMKIKSMFDEKADTSNLALDGQLFHDQVEEVNVYDLLKGAQETWAAGVNTIHEHTLADAWARTRSRLQAAQAAYNAAQAGATMLEEMSIPDDAPAPVTVDTPDPESQDLERLWSDILTDQDPHAHPQAIAGPAKPSAPAPSTPEPAPKRKLTLREKIRQQLAS